MNSIKQTISEFGPALRFLGVFVTCYVIGSLIYGFYIESFGDKVDPWTRSVSQQVAMLLSPHNESIVSIDSYGTRSCSLANREGEVLSVFEGCNGLNVVILFISFLIAYRGPTRKFLIFSAVGVVVIHIVNLGRVALLYFVAESYPNYLYFSHKYLFTAIIYIVVFGLWYYWVAKFNVHPKVVAKNS